MATRGRCQVLLTSQKSVSTTPVFDRWFVSSRSVNMTKLSLKIQRDKSRMNDFQKTFQKQNSGSSQLSRRRQLLVLPQLCRRLPSSFISSSSSCVSWQLQEQDTGCEEDLFGWRASRELEGVIRDLGGADPGGNGPACRSTRTN